MALQEEGLAVARSLKEVVLVAQAVSSTQVASAEVLKIVEAVRVAAWLQEVALEEDL